MTKHSNMSIVIKKLGKRIPVAIVTKTRNSLAVGTIIDFLEENNPFDSNIDKCDLISLGTGLTDHPGECNSKTAKKFGEEFYQIRSN